MRYLVLFSLAALGCNAAELADEVECTPGDTLDCSCDDGAPGEALCLRDHRRAACECELARTLPCSRPGGTFSCECEGGGRGTSICKASGAYTPCACERPARREGDAGGPPSPDDSSSLGPVSACPQGFSCVAQMGARVCAKASGIPPLCANSSDCAAAGLSKAECIEPGMSGVRVCVLFCQD